MVRSMNIAAALGPSRVRFALDPDAQHWYGALRLAGLETVSMTDAVARRWDGVFYDRYRDDPSEADDLKALTGRLVIIADDTAPPACADLFIDYSSDRTSNSVDGIPALLGALYAPISPTFRHQPRIRDRPEAVLVSFGGVDAGDATGIVLRGLQRTASAAWQPRVTVALGAKAVHLPRVEALAAKLDMACDIRKAAPDMASIIAQADIVIGAGGLGLFERLASGAASITIETAMHQRKGIAAAAETGATMNLGELSRLTPPDLDDALAYLVNNAPERATLSAAGQRYVDGNGIQRIISRLDPSA